MFGYDVETALNGSAKKQGSVMSIFIKYLSVFGLSMLPIVELRASVPWGLANGLPLLNVLIVSIIGNLVPVPFIILFIRPLFSWLKKKSSFLARIIAKLEKRAENKHELVVRYEMLGLFILVAIPLPGTGAWTGALVASMFDLRLKNALPVISVGVVVAGILMSVISYGVSALI